MRRKLKNQKNNHFMKLLLSSALLFILSTAFQPDQKETLVQKATRIHNAVFTIDTHCDTPMNLVGSDFNVAKGTMQKRQTRRSICQE